MNVDIVILGAGTAGLTAFSTVKQQLEQQGMSDIKVLLINKPPYGTTCARSGCMPSKALIHIAEQYQQCHQAKENGILHTDSLAVDGTAVMDKVRSYRDRFTAAVQRNSTDHLPPEQHITGEAKFIDRQSLVVNDQTIHTQVTIVATGSSPVMPSAWQALGDKVITSETVFELDALPSRMAVIGLGVIGLELGQALANLGVEIIGVEMADTVGGIQDPLVRQLAVDNFSRVFDCHLGQAAKLSASDHGVTVQVGESVEAVSVEVDLVLAALGRRANVTQLGWEHLNIPLNEQGQPDVNENTLQLGDLPIFVCGDANQRFPVVHEAGDDGRIAALNALAYVQDKPVQAYARPVPLSMAFTDPQMAFVGQRYSTLAAAIEDESSTVVAAEVSFLFGRPMVMQQTEGLMRLYGDKSTRKLLGAELLGSRVEHLSHQLAWGIQAGFTIDQWLQLPFYHPTFEEGLQTGLRHLASAMGESPIELAKQ